MMAVCLGGRAVAFELFQFSVAPKYALQNGQMNEYVLYTNGNKLSELNWEIQNISLLGFNATMGWEMLLIEANCIWGFPKDSGQMLDSDWQNTSNYGMKTNYSESSNAVDYLGDLELRLGLNIKTWDFLHIIPYGGISYSRSKFTASGGTYWYGDAESQAVYWYGNEYTSHLSEFSNVSYNSDDAITGSLDSYGDVISYERETFNYVLGVKAKYNFFTRFTVTADIGVAVFTQINSVDHHILKDNTSSPSYYFDKMQGFFKSFNFGAEFDVKIWQGLSAGAGGNFVFVNQILGKDYSKKSTDSKYTLELESAAADCFYYNIEFFVRYSF